MRQVYVSFEFCQQIHVFHKQCASFSLTNSKLLLHTLYYLVHIGNSGGQQCMKYTEAAEGFYHVKKLGDVELESSQ